MKNTWSDNIETNNMVFWNFTKLWHIPVLGLLFSNPVFALSDTERIEALEREISEITSSIANRSGIDGLPLRGFLDIGIASNNYEDVAVKLHGFNIGSLDFYLTPQFTDNVKSLIELVFEVDAHGEVVTDFERAQVGYTFNDQITLWGGRFHTPYGYWNTAFHNGAQIQTSVLRPRFLAFGDKGGVLPSHMVGLWATGKIGADKGKITYDAFAGNGPKIVGVTGPGSGTMDSNMAGDNNHDPMVGLNVGYEFSGKLDGLRLAVNGFQGIVDAYDPGDILANSTDFNMLGGSAVYIGDDWEVMSEYYHFNNKDRSGTSVFPGSTYKSWASYLQVGKKFNDLTPYIRLERAVLNQQDNYFGDQETGRSYSRQSVGLSYSLNPKTSLKLELLNSRFEEDPIRGDGKFNSALAQYAIRF